MYRKDKSNELLITILKDNVTQTGLVVCIVAWMVFIEKIIGWIMGGIFFGIIIATVAAILTVMLMFALVIHVIKKNFREKAGEIHKKCMECAQNTKKYAFASFDFYTLEEILDIERKMGEDETPSECHITIYTSSLDTETNDESVRRVARNNLEKKVKYRIYYLRGIPTEKEKELYGEDNLVEYIADADENKDLDLTAEFDIIVFQNSCGDTSGYFSINFSTSVAPRPCAQGFNCKNQCHYENDNLLYKKMRTDSTSLLLYTLRKWDNERRKNEKTRK